MPLNSEIPILSNLAALQPRGQAWICDIWGVLHNGVEVYPSAVAACRNFRADGGRVILVSNAPRPSVGVVAQLDTLGVPRDAYDAVLTSGDVAQAMLAHWIGIPTLHIGPERDRTLFDGKDIPRVEAAIAKRILCSGLYDDTTETPASYRTLLTDLAQRGCPMLCANPDLKVDRGGKIIYCGGAVAALYAELGGQVTYAGKPHAAIYDTARAMIVAAASATIPDTDILAIGDGVLTDIPGGIAAGLRTVYVSSAIHVDGALTAAALTTLFPVVAARPTVAMDRLAYGAVQG
jgi:HAD superfamily hydrolase (TIGR01459 family)